MTLDRRTLLTGGLAALAGAAVLAACRSDDAPEVGAPAQTVPVDGGSGEARRQRLAYGDHDEAFGDLWLPAGAEGLVPTVVLVHGGFWRQDFGLDLMDGLAESLVAAGYGAWNVEYRRVGGRGGWPETFLDVAAAVDHLADPFPGADAVAVPDPDRIAVVGHSAGGHLAGWVAARHRLPADAPGAAPTIRPVVCLPQAGVLDLVRCAREGVGGSACPDLLGGGPDELPERYATASPAELVPTGVPTVCVHGSADRIVPLSQSEAFVAAATAAGDEAEVVVVDGADHFAVIDPGHPAWQVVLDRLPEHLGPG